MKKVTKAVFPVAGMGTRFLLTSDSAVPEHIKKRYLEFGLDGTVVTTKADGMPHRLLRTEFIDSLESGSPLGRMLGTARRTLQFKELSGQTWLGLARDGLRMKRSTGRSWGQMMLAANTPMLLKAGLVNGDTQAGMLASGQVVGVIDDLPTCEQLVDRIIDDAVERLSVLPGFVQNSKDALA